MRHFNICAILFLFVFAILSPRGNAESLLVHYAFNGNAFDSSGHGYTGTVVGASYGPGQYDGAIYFNNPSGGSMGTQYVKLPNISSLTSSSFTVAIRYKSTDTAQNNGRLFGYYDGSQVLEFDYNDGQRGDAYGDIKGTGTGFISYGNRSDPRAVTTDGKWHWAILAVDRTDKSVRFYVDQYLISTTMFTTLGPLPFDKLTLGRIDGMPNYAARNTAVDDFRLYGGALSSSEVNDIVTPLPTSAWSVLLMGLVLCQFRVSRRCLTRHD